MERKRGKRWDCFVLIDESTGQKETMQIRRIMAIILHLMVFQKAKLKGTAFT